MKRRYLAPRSRQGCSMCKIRRKKCDEAKPQCGACARLGYDCIFEQKLYWYSKDQKTYKGTFVPCSPKHMITVMNKDFAILEHLQTHPNERCDYKLTTDLHKPSNQMFIADAEMEVNLFNYYVEVISTKKVFSNTQLNEFKSIVIPNSQISGTLFKTIIAISASDLIRKFPKETVYYSSITNKYKNDAINSMYNMLDNPTAENINEIIICILMLASLEIGAKSNNWVDYLKEACLIFQNYDDDVILATPGLRFCYRYFVLRYILLLTTLNDTELDIMLNRFPMKIIDKIFDSDDIEYMFGCPPKFIRLINRITLIKRLNTPSNFSQMFDELNSIKIVTDDDRLRTCSECYMYAIQLFILMSFPKVNFESFDIHIDANAVKKKLKDNFIKLLDLPDINVFPVWTIFILSLEQIDDVKIMDIFELLDEIWPFSSVSLVKDAVEMIWKLQNLGRVSWKDGLNVCGFKLSLT